MNLRVVVLTLFVCLASLMKAQRIENELLIWLSAPQYAEPFFSKYASKLTYLETISPNRPVYRVRIKDGDPDELYIQIKASPLVSLVQFNHRVEERSKTPNDSLYSQQWSLKNNTLNNADIHAEEAWGITTNGTTAQGDTIVVAVIDGGFDQTHPDLADSWFINRREVEGNGIDDDGNGYKDDYKGYNVVTQNGTLPSYDHGTHVSGIIGAQGNNKMGVAGINWNAKVLPISTNTNSESYVVAAYLYALDLKRKYLATNGEEGAYIVATNSSFGITGGLVADYPIWCALYDSLGEAGIISAGATDNRNTNVDVTGDIPSNCASNFLIIVTNSNQQDDHYAFSAYGNQSVDIAAPGTGILSTTKWVNGGYGQLTGTSMATPHVAGTVALMHAAGCVTFSESTKQQPANTALSIRSKLLRGVDTLSPFEDLVSSRGRLNLFSAVGAINAFPCILDTFPQAEFASNKQGICEGDTVKYADISFNNTQRNWTFNGAQPSTSNDSTPLVLYNNSGKYGVQLIAKNAYGGDTLVWKKYITVSARPAKPTILASGNKLTSSFGEAYQWFDSTGKKVGAQKNLTPAKAGKYIVEISNAFGCKTKSEVYNFFPVGINLLPDERARLSIYPSPADDFIKLENVWCSNSVEVINANGQYVYSSKPSQESFIIDTHLWPQGIYIIRNGDRVTKVAVLH